MTPIRRWLIIASFVTVIAAMLLPGGQSAQQTAADGGNGPSMTDWWLVAFTEALAVVAALQFFALIWQIRTTQKTAESELRAYIFPYSVSRVEDNGVLKLKVVLTNSGKTPARQCVSWVGEGVATAPDPIFPKVPPRGTHSRYFLAAGSDMWVYEDAVQVSAADSRMIANGSRFYFVHGEISYRDAFNKKQTTQFRFASNGDNFAAGRFVFCDDGNNAT